MLLNVKTRRGRRPSQILSLLAGLTAMMALSDQVYHATALYRLLLHPQMAVHTALAFLLLSSGVFFARPRDGIAGLLTRHGSGSVVARRFLPAIFFIPFLVGWLCLIGQSAGLYGPELDLALFAAANIVVFGVLIWLSALKMNAEYYKRSRAEVDLQELNVDLEGRVEQRTKVVEQQWRIFNTTLSSIVDLAYTFDLEGRFRYVNQPLLDLWGLTLEDAVGRTFFELPYPFDLATKLHEQVLQVVATGQNVSDQTPYVSPLGVAGYFEYFFCPVIGAGGNVELVSGASIDITARKSAEAHLAQMEAKYRGLLEAAPDAMVVMNQAGEIVLVNVQAEKQFGYHRGELIGQQVTNIVPEAAAERMIAAGTIAAAATSSRKIGAVYERVGRCKDGSEFPVEIMVSPLESAEGVLITAAIRDVSVRRAAEEHLVQMEAKYRGLLEAAPDAIVVVNQGGEIVLLNVQAEKQFGYHRDELLGHRVTSLIPAGFAERLIADALRSAEDALAQQIGTGIELIGRRKDASEFPIEILLSPLESVEGILVTVAIRNITTRKEAELQLQRKVEELGRSNKELEQFASIASHNLQEPLRMVASFTQLLSRRYKGKLDSDADEYIAFAVDGANRMQRLIQDLLTYSRVGTRGLEVRNASSEDALNRALLNLKGATEGSGAVVTHDPLPDVMADETQLIQLFQNLIGNAIKYQRPGTPQVHVSAAKSGEKKWMFSVRDNGLGIEQQYFERIFGMFQRLHKREEFDGTGIGLAICKKIVERHGGTISVESKVGHGSEDFLGGLFSILSETGQDPRYLELELTESVLMKRVDFTTSTLAALREIGVRVAVDDFGMGYSSLGYLRKFPLDALKIDRSFIHQITTARNETTIVERLSIWVRA